MFGYVWRTLVAFLFSFHFLGALAVEITQKIGPDTNLPIPRFVALNRDEVNMRLGPSESFPVIYVYRLKGYPMRVVGEYEYWRKLEDSEGYVGWVHKALLSGKRNVIVVAPTVDVLEAPNPESRRIVTLEKNVVPSLNACQSAWCEVEIQRKKGWVPKNAIWGIDADEVFEEND